MFLTLFLTTYCINNIFNNVEDFTIITSFLKALYKTQQDIFLKIKNIIIPPKKVYSCPLTTNIFHAFTTTDQKVTKNIPVQL